MNKRKLRQQHFEEMQARARSVTVGTAFGGTTELIMRRGDSSFTFAILQPVEVVELIYQLAANVGCNVELAPRRDFASWRQWSMAATKGPEHGEAVAVKTPKQRRKSKRAAGTS